MSRRVLVVRHAVAESREVFASTGADDALRPLTSEGRRRMQRGAAGLRTMVPDVGVLASSPLRRAVETAEVLAAVYGATSRVTDTLRPEAQPDSWLAWFLELPMTDVTIVGHEPHLSSLVTWLITGEFRSAILLKKGGAALLEFDDPTAEQAGGARLRWLLTPSQLRERGR